MEKLKKKKKIIRERARSRDNEKAILCWLNSPRDYDFLKSLRKYARLLPGCVCTRIYIYIVNVGHLVVCIRRWCTRIIYVASTTRTNVFNVEKKKGNAIRKKPAAVGGCGSRIARGGRWWWYRRGQRNTAASLKNVRRLWSRIMRLFLVERRHCILFTRKNRAVVSGQMFLRFSLLNTDEDVKIFIYINFKLKYIYLYLYSIRG